MKDQDIIPHLFRTEFSKITAVLCKTFGFAHIQAAEDIASETFMAALESWPYKGIPPNPVAWLYAVAKNKARNYLRRHSTYTEKVLPQLTPENSSIVLDDVLLTEENITDSQLQMLFAVCHPSLSTEAQICLALRLLCGFGPQEIADAFLSNKETINKRLLRAKEKLRQENISLELPSSTEISARLDTVLLTLYLLFNEGYYSESRDCILREELCQEAMHLTRLLIRNESTNLAPVNALYALMCFHSSRFPARKDETGEFILYQHQDESRWDHQLITEGVWFLNQAAQGDQLTKYHLEASIAWWHTVKMDSKEKWESILQLYNRLLQIEYSPIAALNRTFALSKANGKQSAIAEAEKLQLKDNHYYYTLLGELYTDIDNKTALCHFQTAARLAKTQTDRTTIQKKIDLITIL